MNICITQILRSAQEENSPAGLVTSSVHVGIRPPNIYYRPQAQCKIWQTNKTLLDKLSWIIEQAVQYNNL